MIDSGYIDGTNRKAFKVTDGTNTIMVTYARPAVYIKNGETIRVWDGFRVTSGKHILKFDPSLHKDTWNKMEVKKSPCTGKFLIDEDNHAVVLSFDKYDMLVINGAAIVVKSKNIVNRISEDVKIKKNMKKYLDKFIGEDVTNTMWDSYSVVDNLVI